MSHIFSQVTINAIKVPGNTSDIGPTSKAWLSARYQNILLYPQITIELDEINKQNMGVTKVKVKAIYDGKNISILLKWRDNSKSPEEKIDPISYADGYAIQLPIQFDDAKKLPYIGMGSKGRTVIVMYNKVTLPRCEQVGNSEFVEYVDESSQQIFGFFLENRHEKPQSSELQRIYIGQGYRNFREVQDKNIDVKMHMLYKKGFWRGTISMPLKSKYLNIDKGEFPISFAIWYGDKKNRGASKIISPWIGVNLEGKDSKNKLVRELSEEAKGDVRNGERLAKENCAACHIYANQKNAPKFMAPNLSNIGGYSTKEYLKESIINPNAILVPGYEKDENRIFSWYDIDEKGDRVSAMPSYDWLDEKSIEDLVAFFMSQK
ncbi:ethylbenzene dehydrogenase-related protein, partial [Sulfurimonas sp.]|uniref:ethylbenzene dehydrogenase-related protein n=1 Tax=Sulfurimonas sp. TaxID=2022749 RepID=UPI00260295F5